ncbi:MAG: Ala-tRNA(Pro) hydrolase [delta proteobacterium ML8_F1]|nr:MAG: Ala-tRNA(Pro) hydrolase [delta proteobacterium ML8_F1]
MTELIYQKDSYVKEFEARVVGHSEEPRGVVLDRTAFYPGGGGQLHDRGRLVAGEKVYAVEKVQKAGDDVLHLIEGELPEVGQTLKGELEWERRYQLMRTHSAMHVVSGVMFRVYDSLVTGGNMEILSARMDFEMAQLSNEMLPEIEEKVNEEIQKGHPIKVQTLTREEAMKVPDLIRTKINLLPEGIESIRTIEIVGLDLQADGGTHVGNTSEIGRVRVVKFRSKGKINKRLYVTIED